MRLMGIPTTWVLVVTGIVMMLAVYLHGTRKLEGTTWRAGSTTK
jgi:ABC-type xylose transport system permease subunit